MVSNIHSIIGKSKESIRIIETKKTNAVDDLTIHIAKATNKCEIEKLVDESIQTYIYQTSNIKDAIEKEVVSYTKSDTFHNNVVEPYQALLNDMSATKKTDGNSDVGATKDIPQSNQASTDKISSSS